MPNQFVPFDDAFKCYVCQKCADTRQLIDFRSLFSESGLQAHPSISASREMARSSSKRFVLSLVLCYVCYVAGDDYDPFPVAAYLAILRNPANCLKGRALLMADDGR